MTELETLRSELETATKEYTRFADLEPEQITDEDADKAPALKERIEGLTKQVRNLAIKEDAANAKKAATNFKRSDTFGGHGGVKVKSRVTKWDYSNAVKAWMLNGHPKVAIKDSWKRSADNVGCNYGLDYFQSDESVLHQFIRDQSTDVAGEGQELLSGTIFRDFVEARAFTGSIVEVCDVINDPLENGNTAIAFTPINDTATPVRYQTAQNQPTQDDPVNTQPQVTLGMKIASTKSYPISIQFLLNPNVNALDLLNRNQGKRLRREIVRVVSTGAGGLEGTGIITSGAVQGQTSAASGNITPSVVNSLYYSVDPEYRNTANTAFIVHDNSVSNMETYLVNTAGFPMWSMDLINGPGATLKGEKFLRNNYLDQFASGNKKWMLYGDFSFMKLRLIGSPQVIVDRSRFADTFSVFVGAWMAYDCHFVEPGNNPVKYAYST